MDYLCNENSITANIIGRSVIEWSQIVVMSLKFKVFYFCTYLIFLLFSCPPRTFLPALCRIFLDECAPDNVLEVTARAITYYLDVSAECTRRIVAVEGAIKAICNRLVCVEMSSRTSRDLAEQCIKVNKFLSFRKVLK